MGQRVSIVQYSVLHKLRSSCLQAVLTGILRGVWAAWLGWILKVTIHTTHRSRIEWQPAPSPAPAGLEHGLLRAEALQIPPEDLEGDVEIETSRTNASTSTLPDTAASMLCRTHTTSKTCESAS